MDKELEARLDEIQRELREIVAGYQNLKNEVDKQEEILFGGKNVHAGLITRMALLEEQIKTVSEKIDDITRTLSHKIDKLQDQLNKSNTKTMLYILTAISVLDGLISILLAIFH
jgi:chromosome segregation ATPase